MTFDWQAVAAPVIVFTAIAYLAWALVGKRYRKAKPGASSGCGSCGSCPSGGDASRNEPELVQIGTPNTSNRPHSNYGV